MTRATTPNRPPSLETGWAAAIHPGEALQRRLALALGGQRPIAYNVNLARAAGDVKAGLFLSQLLYWTRVGIEVDARQGWIFKTREQWTLETGLSRAEQERCRSLLLAAGLIQESRFAGSSARLGFRIQPEALGMAISSMLRRDPVQWTLFDLRSSEQHVRALLGRNLAFYRVYVDALGSVPLAVFVTKAVEIQKRLLEAQIDKERRRKTPAHPEEWQQNWFCLSVEQWEIETALRTGQIRKVKQDLCLGGILEEATQTWPRVRNFIRLDLEKLSQALIRVLNVQRADAYQPASGLLQTLMGRSARADRLTQLDSLTNMAPGRLAKNADRFPGKQLAEFAKLGSGICSDDAPRSEVTSEMAAGRLAKNANWFPGNQLAKIANKSNRSLRIALPSTGEKPRQLARVTRSANQAPENSQSQRGVTAGPEATLCTPCGQFEHDLRRVSAPLHARADLGLQDLTTTTTTSGANARRSLQVGSSVNRRVVVVSSNVSQGSPNDLNDSASLTWPTDLSPADVDLAKRLLAPAPSSRRQALLDELAGRQRGGAVRNPIGYLRQLVILDRQAAWDMVLELAHAEAERRAIKARAAEGRGAALEKVPQEGSADARVAGVPPPPDVRQRLRELRATIVSNPANLRQVRSTQSTVAMRPSQVCDANQHGQAEQPHGRLLADTHHEDQQCDEAPGPGRLESRREAAQDFVIKHQKGLL